MKINSLRLKNLNSLKGEFHVHFSDDSPLGQAGIFAITGSIGAGKTTILDAICVALYGRTPRLDISNSGRLMTSHTGECYAEVEFSVKKTLYRSKWSLRRSRGKSDGKFQASTMELAKLDGQDATIIEEKKSNVLKRIIELTGLDFMRFTRSILLAQGNFAAFLNAKDNERADLLEKMTGTEIYSLISMEAYKRFKEEENKLEKLKYSYESVRLMTLEELKERKTKSIEIDIQIKKEEEKNNELDKKYKWLVNIQEIKKVINNSQLELEIIETEQEKNQPELDKLIQGLKTLPLKGAFDVLQNKRKQKETYQSELNRLNKEIPELKDGLNQTVTVKQKSETALEAFLKDMEKEEHKINLALIKDQQITKETNTFAERSKIRDSVRKSLLSNQNQLDNIQKEINKATNEIQQCCQYLEDNKTDLNLDKDLPLIKEQVTHLTKLLAETDKSKKQLIASQKDLKNSIKTVDEINIKKQQSADKLKDLAENVSKNEKKYQEIRKGRTLDDWISDQRQLEDLILKNDRLIDHGKMFEEIYNKLIKTKEKQENTIKKLIEGKSQQDELLKIQKTEEKLMVQLEQKKELELLITKYEDDRKKLKPGESCPLCGAKEHPWTTGRPLEDEGIVIALAEQKKKLTRNQQQLEKLLSTITKMETINVQCNTEKTEYEEKQKDILKTWQKIAKDMPETPAIESWQHLEKNKLIKTDDLLSIKQKITELKQVLEAKTGMEKTYMDLEKTGLKLISELDLAENIKKQKEQDCERLIDMLESQRQELGQLQDKIGITLAKYSEFLDTPASAPNLVKKLEKRVLEFAKYTRRLDELTKNVSVFKEKKSGLDSEISVANKRYEEETEQMIQLTAQIEELKEERFELLGNRNPEESRTALKTRRLDMEKEIKILQDELTSRSTNLNTKQGLLEKHQKECRTLGLEIQQLTDDFKVEFTKVGFLDEQDYECAILPISVQTRLEKMRDEFIIKKTKTKTRLEDAKNKLASELEKELTDEELETISQAMKEKKSVLEQLQQELGALQETLRQHDQIEKEQKELLKKMNQQDKEFQRWKMLSDLIGAADGKKFRRFAQGLTLDYLISLANKNLQKLNDRYYLQRNEIEELGLEVVDSYQANIARSTNTLSGGETFLASLSLALGLSNLASQSTTIDSLFLDEGFGTLDMETLETALAALDSLNAEGKTIGIISHIDALKERIPTQLHVIKQSGGLSRLEIIS